MDEKLDLNVRGMMKKLTDKNPELNMILDESDSSPEFTDES